MVNAANSVDLINGGLLRHEAFAKLRDQLFLSPRLSQWQFSREKDNSGYWLRSQDQTATVTVMEDKVILSAPDHDNPKYPFNYDVVAGLPATTLYKAIQQAQRLQPTVLNNLASNDEDSDEFFNESDPEYIESAGLDAALEETHAEPLVEDDAELIEEVTAEEALNEDQRREDGTYPVISVTKQFINDITDQGEELAEDEQEVAGSFTAKANRKNAVTDGVECSYCGNLNRSAYKGTCPKCPKQTKEFASMIASLPEPVPPKPGRDSASEAWLMGRLKSLQGRILTIVDASPIADKAQRDAVKSLLNKEFRREMNKVSDGGWRVGNPRCEGEE